MTEPSASPETAASRLPLGSLVLDLAVGELLGTDEKVTGLRRQALELLLVLGRRAGQVVGKDELMDLVWPDVVVGEGSLTQAIADIRRALGDTEHRLVRNMARRGYMLVPDSAALAADLPALSIAVMPFALDGSSGDSADNAWIADALHGDLVTQVARTEGSFVIARDTAATYQHKAIDPRVVARELRVRHVVLGRMRIEGDRLRVNLALVDGDSGVQRWADVLVVERARLPQAVADFAMEIQRALLPELYRAAAQQRATLSALEVSADDLAMRGVAQWLRGFNRDNTLEGLKLVERAVALDADSLRGWNGLVAMNLQGMSNGWVPDRAAARRRIEEAAAHIERLEHDGFYHLQAKVILAYLHADLAALLRITAAWTERHRHPNAFGARGMATLLNGQADEAVAALETALRLSPRDSIRAEWQYRLAMAHFCAGRYELAIDWGLTAADTNPNLPWPPIHAAAMLQLGQADAARQAFSEHMAKHPGFEASHIVQRLPGGHARFVEARERLVASLESIGMQ